MQLPIYKVDAFTDKIFGGNPAAVCPLDFWLEDEILQAIAMENNLSETAFFIPEAEGFQLRWFTPTVEVRLCGHATLATAHVIYKYLDFDKSQINFYTKSGQLSVSRIGEESYLMDFPSDHPVLVQDPKIIAVLEKALSVKLIELWRGRDDFLAIVEDESQVRRLYPDFRALAMLDSRGLIVSSKGSNVDFVSRGFFPQTGVDEDPATGSAHTLLTPYWAPRLKTNRMHALQLSARVGTFECIYKGERTAIIGHVVDYLRGQIDIPLS